MESIGDFPFWILWFDAEGRPQDRPAIDRLVNTELATFGVTDLFIFSHGWNNDQDAARSLYTRFFEEMDDLLKSGNVQLKPGVKIGTAGVYWPSMYWPDETNPARDAAASADGGPELSDGDLVRELKDAYEQAAQKETIEQLAILLEKKSDKPEKLERFHQLMSTLAPTKDVADAEEDHGEEEGLFGLPPKEVFEKMNDAAPAQRVGGEAGLFDNIWNGAKTALRQTSYFEMKKRAGKVGQFGLGPVVEELRQAVPDIRVHLIGHSFGARVVSFSLRGLAKESVGAKSPVKSLLLLQGAFSHFAFTSSHPYHKNRGGALAGMAERVDGPILASFSGFDSAVGQLYTAASFVSRDDAAAAEDKPPRWGAIGSDGIQSVNADEAAFGSVGQPYSLQAGKFLNLDGNHLITRGGPPSGAHSDIIYPEIAWACLSGAQVVS